MYYLKNRVGQSGGRLEHRRKILQSPDSTLPYNAVKMLNNILLLFCWRTIKLVGFTMWNITAKRLATSMLSLILFPPLCRSKWKVKLYLGFFVHSEKWRLFVWIEYPVEININFLTVFDVFFNVLPHLAFKKKTNEQLHRVMISVAQMRTLTHRDWVICPGSQGDEWWSRIGNQDNT